MKTVNKAAFLMNLENQVEKHISDTLMLFQNRDEAFLNTPSSKGGWSIAQCLDHLNSYGFYYLPKMREKLINSANCDCNTFLSTWLGTYFTKTMDPQTGKKKYKAFKGHIPDQNLDAAGVVAEFVSQQEEMLALLRIGRTKDLNVVKIPVSIAPFLKLRLGDVFQFMIAHNERHMQQARRNLTCEESF